MSLAVQLVSTGLLGSLKNNSTIVCAHLLVAIGPCPWYGKIASLLLARRWFVSLPKATGVTGSKLPDRMSTGRSDLTGATSAAETSALRHVLHVSRRFSAILSSLL